MDMQTGIQVAAAFLGSIGFALLWKVKGKQVWYSGIGGALTWLVYLLVYHSAESYFIGNFAAAIFVGVYAELMARVNRAPATIFLASSAVPLIPGASLYYMMVRFVEGDLPDAFMYGETALVIAIAISLGFMVVTILHKYTNALTGRLKGKRN